jgi:hypothetical protein
MWVSCKHMADMNPREALNTLQKTWEAQKDNEFFGYERLILNRLFQKFLEWVLFWSNGILLITLKWSYSTPLFFLLCPHWWGTLLQWLGFSSNFFQLLSPLYFQLPTKPPGLLNLSTVLSSGEGQRMSLLTFYEYSTTETNRHPPLHPLPFSIRYNWW